jgi:two-component system OmpR family sensor kinase
LGDFGLDAEGLRIANTRRPRRFGAQGQPMGPPGDEAFDENAVRRAVEGQPSFSNGEYQGAAVRIFTRPETQDGHVRGVIQVAQETQELDRLWRSQIATLLILVPLALIVAAGGALFLTGRAIRPIAEMREAAASITEADLSRRLVVEGTDELGELGRTFNAMVERLEVSFRDLKLAYSDLEEASENQRRFTADASHELRTPLTRLRLATDVALASGATEADRQKALEMADSVSRSLARLVQELLILARADAGQMNLRRESIDLRLVASDAVSALTDEAAQQVRTEFATDAVTIEGDAEALGRVCTNLLENARRYTRAEGKITIRVAAEGISAALEVIDTGCGIPPEHLPRITERFYRVDPSRSSLEGGSGLGLAICAAIVAGHGGTLRVESVFGKGTKVLINLPRKGDFK